MCMIVNKYKFNDASLLSVAESTERDNGNFGEAIHQQISVYNAAIQSKVFFQLAFFVCLLLKKIKILTPGLTFRGRARAMS